MVSIFCRHSRWSNSFYPLESPDSLTRQSEKRLSSSFEKRGASPYGPLRTPLCILNRLDKRPPLQPRAATQALSTIHGYSFAIENGSTYTTISKIPTLQERKMRLEMLCRNPITGTLCGKGRAR